MLNLFILIVTVPTKWQYFNIEVIPIRLKFIPE